ncbi:MULTISPECIES: hypothetical protein [Nocardia]|nr:MULTISPECIES: hypothetical protein [Nocardia]
MRTALTSSGALSTVRSRLLADDPAAEFEWALRSLLDGVLGPEV